MNHRDLVLSAPKMMKFGFLKLPFDLQDEVISGLDERKLTIFEAEELIRGKGYRLSHDAVSNYYRAVRLERRRALLDRAGGQRHPGGSK